MKMNQIIESEIALKNYQHELELCQKAGGDIEEYRRLSLDVNQLEQVRLGLESGIDVSRYLNPDLSWIDMENIRINLETGIDMSVYSKKGFNWMQCNEIREGLLEGVDVSKYADKNIVFSKMREVRKGLKKGVDISSYVKEDFNWYQLREIRRGMEQKVDVKQYAKIEFKHMTMRAIRKGFLQNVNIVPYAKKGYNGSVLVELVRGLSQGNDISSFAEKGYTAEQLAQINAAYENDVNLIPYLSRDFHGVQLEEIVKGLKKKLDVSVYADPQYSWFQMREIRFGMEDKVDVKMYLNKALSPQQMAEIRKGLLAGVDVSEFAKVYYEPEQMREICERLEEESSVLTIEMERALRDTMAVDEPEAEETIATDDFVQVSCISLSGDSMTAVLNLSVLPEEKKKALEVSDIMQMLKQHGVKQGIKKAVVEGVIKEKQFDSDVVVAEGRLPVDGENGKFLYYFRKEKNHRPKVLEDGSVDYKNMQLFETVENGQLIAEYIPGTQGVFGYDVTGKLLSPKKGKELPPLHGKGFTLDDEKRKYYSLMDGVIEVDVLGNISVRDLYVIPGNIDASTGNINFNGDITISGNVEHGFCVTATGNVVIDGHCEGGIVHAGKDIIIRKGCQGQGVGELIAGGNVTGQFFESVVIEAGGNVFGSYLLNSQVKAAGKLMVEGRKGVIIGGYTCAKEGVECFGIGNIAEIGTIIEVGIDKEDMAAYQQLLKKIEKLENDRKAIENALPKAVGQPDLYSQLVKAQITTKNQKRLVLKERAELTERMTAQKNARISVSGMVYPGVKVFMNTEPYTVMQEQRGVKFIKPNNGKIEMVGI